MEEADLERNQNRRSVAGWEWAQIGVFALLIALPGLRAGVSGSLTASVAQDEPPARKAGPKDSRRSPLAPALERFNSGFGFRKELIRWHSLLLVRGLGVSGSDRTYIGRNGWHFLAKEQPKAGPRLALLNARNAFPLSDDQAAAVAQRMEEIRRRMASEGIRYYFVVAPNKETIYRDQLPLGFTYSRPDSRLDQLLATLRRDTQVTALDLREPLRNARAHGDVYFKTDSHWNQLGALAAQEVIIGALQADFPDLRPLTLKDVRVTNRLRPGGDLARIIGMQEDLTERVPILQLPAALAGCGLPATLNSEGRDVHPADEVITDCPAAPIERAVILRDSFGDALVPVLSPHFKRAVYLWNDPKGLNWERILKERPQVVIHEVVERSLVTAFRPNASGLGTRRP